MKRVGLVAITLVLVDAAASSAQLCTFGPDTCLPGFVWREAFPGDHVCVDGATRAQAATDNALASQRRSPTGGAFGPDTCLPGFVWREASPTDHVCVDGATRARAASDNAQAAARRDPQCAAPTDTSPPALIQTTLTFYRVPDGAQVGTTVVPPAGVTVPSVPRDRRFVIATSAGDNESGVASLTAAISETWSCTNVLTGLATSLSPLIDGRSDEDKSGTAALGSPLLRSAHFSIDPFAGNPLRLACPATSDASALTVSTALTAQNGRGRSSSSAPIVVIYAARPHTGLGMGAICGNKTSGQTAVCTTGMSCDFRRERVCSGWWIFSRCDYIRSVDMFCL